MWVLEFSPALVSRISRFALYKVPSGRGSVRYCRTMTWRALHVSQTIDRSVEDVIAFAGDPRNLPEWAAGLTTAELRRAGDEWVTDSPMGLIKIRFGGPVAAGVLDHDVTTADGMVVHNPMRVLANDGGSEVVFTLYQRDDMTSEEFERDAGLIRDDLARLRDLLEP